MELTQTKCCALGQLSIKDTDSIDDIQNMIDELQSKSDRWYGLDTSKPAGVVKGNQGEGQRAVFCIVAPGEDELRENLVCLGFTEVTTFNRRNGYPTGTLEMWFLDW